MLYLAFCSYFKIHPYRAGYQDVCAFLEYLARFIPAPSTIKNKLSHIRTHMALVEESAQVLSHPRVHRAIDAMERDKEYVPRTKDPIPSNILAFIIHKLDISPMSNIMRSILLTMYYGALRQSELLPNSTTTWSHKKHPTRADVMIEDGVCSVFVKFGKNMQKIGQNRMVRMASAEDPALCPVAAMKRVYSDTPTRSPSDPLYMFPNSRKPVPVTYARKEFTRLLSLAGFQHLLPHLSLHSLRKAAATNAFAGGCSELSIKRYGAWSSDAYASYIKTSDASVNQQLILSLQQTT